MTNKTPDQAPTRSINRSHILAASLFVGAAFGPTIVEAVKSAYFPSQAERTIESKGNEALLLKEADSLKTPSVRAEKIKEGSVRFIKEVGLYEMDVTQDKKTSTVYVHPVQDGETAIDIARKHSSDHESHATDVGYLLDQGDVVAEGPAKGSHYLKAGDYVVLSQALQFDVEATLGANVSSATHK